MFLVSSDTGTSVEQIAGDLRAGQSLSDIAGNQVGQVEGQANGLVQAWLRFAEANGKLTADQAVQYQAVAATSSCQDLWNSFQQELGASGHDITSLQLEAAVGKERSVRHRTGCHRFRAKTRLPRFVTSNGTGTEPAASHAMLGSASLPTR